MRFMEQLVSTALLVISLFGFETHGYSKSYESFLFLQIFLRTKVLLSWGHWQPCLDF